ncbi:hypothetical protein QYF61_000382 [Mycteria americana]|uniref:Uncharacterized protein n=1 Tax=Mycteria americana TaxID=33587 RepID=A0AAN7S1F0_MYCAM|nr:hypothetical protein QYF61_000382 [Mycteria americana]
MKKRQTDFSVVPTDRTRGNRHKLKHGKLQLSTRRNVFTLRAVKHGHRLPRKVVESPSIELDYRKRTFHKQKLLGTPITKAKQSQLPQPLLIRLMLQTLHQLRCPSLDTLQHLNVSLGVRGPKLNTVFEVWPHQCRVQGHNHFPSPVGHTISDTSQDAIGFLGHVGTLLAHVQLAVNQHPQVLFCRAAFQPLFPKIAPSVLHNSYSTYVPLKGHYLDNIHSEWGEKSSSSDTDEGTVINNGNLVSSSILNMTIYSIVTDIQLSTYKPKKEVGTISFISAGVLTTPNT